MAKSAAIIKRRDKTFSGELSLEDRRKLRAIVVKTHKHLFAFDLSNEHIDEVIDALGPQVARSMVLKAIAADKID